MKFVNFSYQPKDKEQASYELMVLEETSDYFSGIELSSLSEENRKELYNAVQNLEKVISQNMKNFRRFNKDRVIEEFASEKVLEKYLEAVKKFKNS